ncbi:MAG: bifunctional molybdenum cofactor biosynthesis protein MoaC/MoaB [Elusimicrobia bacterium]|nr:bifunctional molybdenum cofactor biosynthesis protein MoaC/MoaB [Elusimicrobiota bacterium]
MIDISNKYKTLRTAKACAMIYTSPKIIKMIRDKKIEKGDTLETARIAGIIGGKKTWEIIPYCHQIPIDNIKVDFEILKDHIKITAAATAIWKTGVEMEALVSASIAALTIYDMIKPLNAVCQIREIKLIEKKGGKSDLQKDFQININAAVLVCSDSVYNEEKKDKSGLLIKEILSDYKNVKIKDYKILPDEKEIIKNKILEWCNKKIDIVLITGGTGLGPRDTTTESLKEIIGKDIPGISEAMRSFGQERTPYSMLSRGICGMIKKTLIISLPGSSKGVKESLSAILPGVFHSFLMIEGKGHK